MRYAGLEIEEADNYTGHRLVNKTGRGLVIFIRHCNDDAIGRSWWNSSSDMMWREDCDEVAFVYFRPDCYRNIPWALNSEFMDLLAKGCEAVPNIVRNFIKEMEL